MLVLIEVAVPLIISMKSVADAAKCGPKPKEEPTYRHIARSIWPKGETAVCDHNAKVADATQ